jgi:hypothetical protein
MRRLLVSSCSPSSDEGPTVRAIDREAPLQFLRTAFQPDDWVAIFLKSYETGRVTPRVGPLGWVMHPRFQAWLRFKNSQKYDVYCGINAIAPWRRTRTRDSVGAVRHVFLEADRDGPAVLVRIGARSDLREPSYVLHSSAGRVHVFWRVSGFEPNLVEALQKQLAREPDTDPAATPSTQATRLVGYNNRKYTAAHLVTIDYGRTDRLYTYTRRRSSLQCPSSLATRHRHCGPRQYRWGSYEGAPRLDLVERARRCLARVPSAIAGEHGHVHTFRVCCRLVRGFAPRRRDSAEAGSDPRSADYLLDLPLSTRAACRQ